MNIVLRRIAKRPTYTIGRMYIDGRYFCDTCEDCDRGLRDDMAEEYIKHAKVYGVTAIPTGTYDVTITYSPKFKKNLPLLHNVKGFSGIRIHNGNSAEDSLGCILVGKNTVVGKVMSSRITMDDLMNKLKFATDIKITIE